MDPHLDVAQLWGKSAGLDAPYPVLAHMLDTAAIAAELLEACPRAVRDLVLEPFVDAAEPAVAAAAFAGAHDLGKVSPSFQALDPAAGATALEALGADPVVCGYHPHAHITQLTLPEALGAL